MRHVTTFAFQGDILLQRVDSLPEAAKPAETNIIALSETHHHHVAEGAQVFAVPDGMTLFMKAIGKSIDIVHKRSYDTHETIRLDADEPGAIWKVRRQREFTPEGWRRVED